MWIEIINPTDNTVIGAVNSEACDIIKIDARDANGSSGGALIRNGQTSGEVYKTRVSYLRLIETLTQSEITTVQQITNMVEDKQLANQALPRIVMPGSCF